MRIHAVIVCVTLMLALPAAAQFQTWDQKNGWSKTGDTDSAKDSKETGGEATKSVEAAFERPELLVMVFEDAKLHTEASRSAKYFRANHRTMPRAVRPFIFIGQDGEWVELQSFSTADVGRVAICPYSGLTDLRIRLYVHESDISEKLPVSALPPMLDPVSEYRLDGCRNPDARREPTAPTDEDPGPILNITADRDVIGPHLDPLTALTWPSGDEAGVVRTRFALPALYRHRGKQVCFKRSLVSTGIGDPFAERLVEVCTESKAIRY